jgi:IS5 family transposase
LVEIRKRMGEAVFEGFHRAIIEAHEGKKPVEPEPQAPTDASLRSESDAGPIEEKPCDSPEATSKLSQKPRNLCIAAN